MEAFQIARKDGSVLVTMDTTGIEPDLLVELLRRIQVEYLAQKVNFDESILELGKEINEEWWQKNKDRLLGQSNEDDGSK